MLAWTLAFASGIYCLLQFSTIPSSVGSSYFAPIISP